ncbi:MAG: GNAT family N-acetyltransferase [Beijerinckiaceae bacterium]|nr:GNAT family N-acetyltransferase [Beijerinckiaceae bacterium]
MHSIMSIEAHASWNDIAEEWRVLEQECQISGYQTRKWTTPWLRTIGAAHGLEPLLILARDETGAPAALLVLTVNRKTRITVASYAGGRDSNINMPLVRPNMLLDRGAIHRVLTEGARAAGVDAFSLLNQPSEWCGAAHPLAQLPSQPSPSLLHGTTLLTTSEAVVASMSGDSKKRMRWRMRKLQDVGPVTFMQARSPEEIVAVVDAFRRQKKVRIDAMGVSAGFDIDLVAAFMEEAALAPEPGVELHALKAGERIVAIYGGVTHASAFHAMVNSYDTDPEVSRTSPGELVTIRLLQALCDRGVTKFDLGVGEAAYKDKWCERHEPMFDSFIGITAKGKAYALTRSAKQSLKRNIKQSPWLWPLAKKIRARLHGDA